jgi:excisionase family DNA binding protein
MLTASRRSGREHLWEEPRLNDPLAFLSSEAREALEKLVRRVVDERLRAAGADRREPPLLTVPEAAERIRAKPQRIYDLLSDGRLTRHKDGSRVLVSSRELDAYVGNSRRG